MDLLTVYDNRGRSATLGRDLAKMSGVDRSQFWGCVPEGADGDSVVSEDKP